MSRHPIKDQPKTDTFSAGWNAACFETPLVKGNKYSKDFIDGYNTCVKTRKEDRIPFNQFVS